MPDRPNVLLFAVDELRASDMGCAGNPIVQTPNLDRLASEGVRFERAYCANTICMPARASMFTGLLPRDHGVWSNGMEMRPDIPVLPALLADEGYRTHAVGKLHLSRWWPFPGEDDPVRYPESGNAWRQGRINRLPTSYFGFQTADFAGGHGNYIFGEYARWLEQQRPDGYALLQPDNALERPSGALLCWKMGLPQELHYNTWVADRAIQFIQEMNGRDQPFFLWCSFPDPHEPYAPPAPYCDMYRPADMPLPVRRQGELDELPTYYRAIFEGQMGTYGITGKPMPDVHWQEIRALTYGMISFVDAEVGRVLRRLQELGLREKTVVGFISDHGDMMGDHWMVYKGPYMFEGCARVPWLMSAPGGARGQVCRGLASQIDLAPTILDLCQVPSPNARRLGMSRKRQKVGQLAPIDLWPGKSLVPVLRGDDRPLRSAVVIHNDDPTLGLKIRTIVTDRFKLTFYPGQGFGELFDLREDPGELHNLWDLSEWKQLRTDLLCRLLDEDTLAAPWHPIPYTCA